MARLGRGYPGKPVLSPPKTGIVAGLGGGSLAATATFGGTGTATAYGGGSLTATATRTGTGFPTVFGGGSLAATATITGAGNTTFYGGGSLHAVATMTGTSAGVGSGKLSVYANTGGKGSYSAPVAVLPGGRVQHNPQDLSWLAAAIQSPDPAVAMNAANALAYVEQNPPQDARRRLFDRTYNEINEVNDHIDLKLSKPRLALPTGTLTLKGTDPLVDYVLQCDTTTIPFVWDKGAVRWSGRIDVAHDRLKDGINTVECELIHDRVWLDRILAWPDPWAPILAQVPFREWWGIGPAITVMKTLIAEQALRIQTGLWELVNNLGSLNPDVRAWFGTLLMQNNLSLNDLMQAVTTPIAVVFTDPLFDTSPWIEIDGRMDTVWKLMQQQLEDNGLYVDVNVWLPGEPQPAGMIIPLQVATIVVDIKDRANRTGFSGTFLDGLELDLVDLEGSVLGEVVAPLLNPNNEFAPAGVNIAPLIGVNYVKPWVMFNCDNIYGGVIEHDVSHHHPLAWQIVTGGKSPKWLVCAPRETGGRRPNQVNWMTFSTRRSSTSSTRSESLQALRFRTLCSTGRSMTSSSRSVSSNTSIAA